jgi:hypothetical protein
MELVLKQKGSADDRDPLIVFIENQETKTKEIRKIVVGQSIEVSDDIGYQLLSKYKGMFVQKTAPAEGYTTKVVKAKE